MSLTSTSPFPTGHRARGSGLSMRDIPAIEAGFILAQNRGIDYYVDSVIGVGGDHQPLVLILAGTICEDAQVTED